MTNPKKPLTNSALIKQIEQLRREYNQTNEQLFYQALREATFLTPVSIDSGTMPAGATDELIITQESQVEFIQIADQADHYFLLAFTDGQELERWSHGQAVQTLLLNLHDFLHLLSNYNEGKTNGVVLNPFSHNIVFDRELLQDILNQPMPKRPKSAVQISTPQPYPIELVKQLKQQLTKLTDVEKVYLLLMHRQKSESYLLIVDAGEEPEQYFQAIAELAKPLLKGSEQLDFAPYNHPFGREASEGQEPFYQKGITTH